MYNVCTQTQTHTLTVWCMYWEVMKCQFFVSRSVGWMMSGCGRVFHTFEVYSLYHVKSSWAITHILLKCSVFIWKQNQKKKNQTGTIKQLDVFRLFIPCKVERNEFDSAYFREEGITSCFLLSKHFIIQCAYWKRHPWRKHAMKVTRLAQLFSYHLIYYLCVLSVMCQAAQFSPSNFQLATNSEKGAMTIDSTFSNVWQKQFH